jgi:hypothetical protein
VPCRLVDAFNAFTGFPHLTGGQRHTQICIFFQLSGWRLLCVASTDTSLGFRAARRHHPVPTGNTGKGRMRSIITVWISVQIIARSVSATAPLY